jgi:hypothetical protein
LPFWRAVVEPGGVTTVFSGQGPFWTVLPFASPAPLARVELTANATTSLACVLVETATGR